MKKPLLILAAFLALTVVPFQTKAQSIAGGGYHSLFLCSNNTAMACGDNSYGGLGNGGYNIYINPNPSQVYSISNITALSAGGTYFSLFLKKDSTVWACGYNSFGQLGDGTVTDKLTPVQASSLNGITAIAGGITHSLFLKYDSTVWACGDNYNGQLGIGVAGEQHIPVQVNFISGITAIAAKGYSSFFLKKDSTVWACGLNDSGQLGDGTTIDKSTPIQISGLIRIIAIAAGEYHTLFLKNDGTVWACGYNGNGQLGDGTTTDKLTPVQVSSLSGITAIAAGYFHSLFLKNDSTVWGCGANVNGQLGNGTTGLIDSIPGQISSFRGITAIAGGGYHSLFLKNDGTVWACGRNSSGQLGDGATTSKSPPIQVMGLCSQVAVEENLLENSISIYPIPFSIQTTLHSTKIFKDVSLIVYNSLGQTIKQISNLSGQTIIFRRDNLPCGMYIIQLMQDNKTFATDKLVITDN